MATRSPCVRRMPTRASRPRCVSATPDGQYIVLSDSDERYGAPRPSSPLGSHDDIVNVLKCLVPPPYRRPAQMRLCVQRFSRRNDESRGVGAPSRVLGVPCRLSIQTGYRPLFRRGTAFFSGISRSTGFISNIELVRGRTASSFHRTPPAVRALRRPLVCPPFLVPSRSV